MTVSSSSTSPSTNSEVRWSISSISWRVRALLLGQSAWKWPYPWHLKDFQPSSCLGNSLTKDYTLSYFPGSFGVTYGFIGLKVLSGAVGLTNEPPNTLFPLEYFSTLIASLHKSSKDQKGWSSTFSAMVGSNPLRNLAMVCSGSSSKPLLIWSYSNSRMYSSTFKRPWLKDDTLR